MIEADVASGRAVQMTNTADRPGFGPLSSYWLYYPDAGSPGRGEVTWWNSQSQLDGFIETVKSSELGGVFTWTSTSDAADWRVHKRLHAQLAALKTDDSRVATRQLACNVTPGELNSSVLCDEFCTGKCAFYNTTAEETGQPLNLSLFITPANVTGLRNKDTGDLLGDMEFVLPLIWSGVQYAAILSKNSTATEAAQSSCKKNGWLFGIGAENLLYARFTVESCDGQWGPYLACNPLYCDPKTGACDYRGHNNPMVNLSSPQVWQDTTDFHCTTYTVPEGYLRPTPGVTQNNIEQAPYPVDR